MEIISRDFELMVLLESIERYYEHIGGNFISNYAAILSGQKSKLEKNDIEQIMNLVSCYSKGNLLDAGCGPAYWAKYYAKKVDSLTLLDFSPSMIVAAVDNIRVINFMLPINPVIKSIEEYSLGNENKYDVIVLGFVLSHYSLNYASSLLCNLKSMLTSDGKIIIVDSLLLKGAGKRDKTIYKMVPAKDKNIVAPKHYFREIDIYHMLDCSGLQVVKQYIGSYFFSTVVKSCDF